MPICIACKEDKAENDFRFRDDRNWRETTCKPCEREIQQRNYYRSKDEQPLTWRIRVMRNNVSKQISLEWLTQTLGAQGGCCALSGRAIDLLTCEVDHILPTTRGGSDDLQNLRLVCTRANEAKGNMTDNEFFTLCADVLRKSSGGRS